MQLRSAINGLEQQEKLLEPFLIRSEEMAKAKRGREETLNSVGHEVESLRKLVAQQVNFLVINYSKIFFNMHTYNPERLGLSITQVYN